jgi:hypothetical protein
MRFNKTNLFPVEQKHIAFVKIISARLNSEIAGVIFRTFLMIYDDENNDLQTTRRCL